MNVNVEELMRRAAVRWASAAGVAPGAVDVQAGAVLHGGTQAALLQRFTVDAGSFRAALVLKLTWCAEFVALSRLAPLATELRAVPRLVDGDFLTPVTGAHPPGPLEPAWIVTPFVDGVAASGATDLPLTLFADLADLHASTIDVSEPPIVEITASWFAHLAGIYVTGEIAGTPGIDPGVISELTARTRHLARSEAIERALRTLPRCLLHGDVHAGNVLVADDGTAVLLDWANARIGPMLVDLANVAEPGSAALTTYLACLEARLGQPLDRRLVDVGYWYATVQINTQYLPWVLANHGSAAAVAMSDRAVDAEQQLRRVL
ncbi:MAG: phosphotransferase [Ilumatobacteraceae bacterium]